MTRLCERAVFAIIIMVALMLGYCVGDYLLDCVRYGFFINGAQVGVIAIALCPAAIVTAGFVAQMESEEV